MGRGLGRAAAAARARPASSVAVVGAGPGGHGRRAAAAPRRPRASSLFERDEAAGGLVRFGVPDFKIEKRVVERRVEQLVAEGVELRCGVDVGVDVTVDELREQFDAVVLAIGSRVPRDLPVPGRELDGVHFAMDYLYVRNRWVARVGPSRRRRPSARSRARASTSSSSAAATPAPTASATRSARARASVVQLELLPEPPAARPDDRTPWPLWPLKFRLSYAMEEAQGGRRGEQDFSVVTTHFARRRRRASARCTTRRPSPRRRSRRSRAPRASSQAELVLLAMGFLHPEHEGVVDAARRREGPARQRQGRRPTRPRVEGVFAAGDARRGQSLIVWAINEGRQCARMVDRYLARRERERRPADEAPSRSR